MPYRSKLLGLLVAAATILTFASPIAASAAGFTSVSVGNFHACATTASGGVWCWGDRSSGQIGDGGDTVGWSDLPTAVAGLSSGATAVASGLYHTCAVISDGALRCWGGNGRGQLGNGTMTDSNVPVTVALSGVTAVSGGGFHTCAIAGGSLHCWGRNDFGQLGNGGTSDSASPVLVAGLTDVVAVSAGALHTCALLSGGSVRCWGWNGYGQLGDGTTANSATPVAVQGLAGVSSISVSAGGFFSCAVVDGHDGYCWGRNAFGELGIGTATSAELTPQKVIGLDGVVASISAGNTHACAVTTGGALYCWGYNADGQLGTNSFEWTESPTAAHEMGGGVLTVVAGVLNTCARTTTGLVCAGDNDYGQLGDGTSGEIFERPTFGLVVFPDSTPPAVSVGAAHCAVPGNDRWCRSAVTATFSAVDSESGVASPCTAGAGIACTFERSSGTNGAAVAIASGAVCDAVGNCSDGISAGPFAIDTVAPTVTCPTDAPTFLKGQAGATVTAGVSDATSGAAAPTVSAAVSTATVGSHSVSLSASDVAGNTGSATCAYRVVYDFDGFFAPLQNTPVENVVAAGRVVPVKFSLNGFHGTNVIATGFPQTSIRGCVDGSDLNHVEETDSVGTSELKYDSTTDTYSYSWKTDKAWAGTCRTFHLRLNDGTDRYLWFRFK